MKRAAALLLVLLACGGSSPASGTGPDAGQAATSCATGDVACAAFVAAHDAARAAAQPAPSPPLPPVGWSGAAAQAAAAWAARCVWGHDPALQTEGFGQNLYASTNEPTPADAVTSWAAEAPDYDYAANTCATGKVCGHYTQVVWRGSTGLGCATQRCTSGSPFGAANAGAWWNVVCDYAPPGNWVGQRPY